MLQHGEEGGEEGGVPYSICCISSCAGESRNDKKYAVCEFKCCMVRGGRPEIDYVFKV